MRLFALNIMCPFRLPYFRKQPQMKLWPPVDMGHSRDSSVDRASPSSRHSVDLYWYEINLDNVILFFYVTHECFYYQAAPRSLGNQISVFPFFLVSIASADVPQLCPTSSFVCYQDN